MDYIAYRIPQGEGHPNISGMEQLRYAENYYICSVIDINLISTGIIQKYGIVKANEQVVRGLEFFIATSESAKVYKIYSSGQAPEFFDEDFNVVNKVFSYFYPDIYFGFNKIKKIIKLKPKIFKENNDRIII